MSLKYLIRRRAVKVNHRKDIKVDIIPLSGQGVLVLMAAKGKGIGQHFISDGMVDTLQRRQRDASLDRALRL